MSDPDSRLVYTTDPDRNRHCPRCKNLIEECQCCPEEEWVPQNIRAVIRLETAGRGGKIVTVIDGFPKNEPKLKDLTKFLKNRCGSGGTCHSLPDAETARIEIQGDKRDLVRRLLSERGMKVNG